MSAELAVVVQTVAGREDSLARTVASLEASDVDEWTVYRDDARDLRQALPAVLRLLHKSGARLALRLEDDADVNRHLAHNVRTWTAPEEPRFGAGWLFSPGGVPGIWAYMRGGDTWRTPPRMHGSVGCVFRTADLPELIEHASKWMAAYGAAQDIALAAAVRAMGRAICHHNPCLVEHRLEPSTLGHVHGRWHTSNGAFKPDWRR